LNAKVLVSNLEEQHVAERCLCPVASVSALESEVLWKFFFPQCIKCLS
jgi:hypothetical protein